MRTNRERLVRWSSVALLLLGTLHAAGCTAVISGAYIVHELLTSESYTVTFRVGADADEVYRSLVEYARARNRRNLPIFKDDAVERQFEAGHRGEYWAWKVWPDGEGSQVTFTAALRDRPPEELRETVHGVLKDFFSNRGLEYEVLD